MQLNKIQTLRQQVVSTTQSAKIPRASHAQFLKNTFNSSHPKWFYKPVSPNLNCTHNLLASWRKTVTSLHSIIAPATGPVPYSAYQNSNNISDAIRTCTLSKPCNSPLCPACRCRAQDNFSDVTWNKFKSVPENEVYFVTILFPVKASPLTTAPQIVDAEKKNLQNLFRSKRRKETRNQGDLRYDDIFMTGAFEIDVVDPKLVSSSESKMVLQNMGVSFRNGASNSYLVHYHGLIYSAGISQKTIKELFKSKYPLNRQVLMKRLYKKNDYEENIRRVSRYMLKYRYNPVSKVYSKQSAPARAYANCNYDHTDMVQYSNLVDKSIGGIEFKFGIKAAR